MSAETGRLFIGIPLTDPMRKTLGMYARQLEPRLPGNYVPPENYHITLAFLGDTPFADVPELQGCIERGIATYSQFEVELNGTGHFGKERSAMLWAGVTHSGHIEAMAASVRSELDKAGFSFDRKPAKAHITIARKVDLTDKTLPELARTTGLLSTVTLFHSTRRGGVLVYLPLAGVSF